MTTETFYTIGELAAAVGVTPRTIRYYTAEGLLPPPDTRGRYALYGAEHLRQLQLIALLKEAYLPLGEIRARIEQLSAEQVQQLLADYRQPPTPPGSATDYIAQLLTTSVAQQATSSTAPRMLAEAAPGYADAEEQVKSGVAEPGNAGSLPIGFARPLLAAPSGPESMQAPAPPAAPAPRGGLFKRFVAQRRDATPGVAAQGALEETWQRVTLAPGVELHMREPLTPDLRTRVDRLIERARELFDNRSGTD